jgi:hypothetical protein
MGKNLQIDSKRSLMFASYRSDQQCFECHLGTATGAVQPKVLRRFSTIEVFHGSGKSGTLRENFKFKIDFTGYGASTLLLGG